MLQCIHSGKLARFIEERGLTLVFSTYQANKLGFLTGQGRELDIFLADCERPMGISFKQNTLAIANLHGIEFYRNFGKDGLSYGGQFYTGFLDTHELCFGRLGLWGINTMFSSLSRFESGYSFNPIWQPPFITELAAEDRCHLNGLALWQDMPRFLTYLAASDTKLGWKETEDVGAVIDITSNENRLEALSSPHSPRVHLNQLYVCESGKMRLLRADLEKWKTETVFEYPGYLRGVVLLEDHALVGVSKCRNTSIGESGILLVNTSTGKLVDRVIFLDQISEIFDLQALPFSCSEVLTKTHNKLPTSFSIPNYGT